MSSEDEFANYDHTTTPFRAVKLDETTVRNPTNTKPNGRAAVAGPSSKTGNANAKRSRKRSVSPIHDAVDDDELVEIPVPTRKVTRPKRATSREPEPVAPSIARTAARSKGKGKARVESTNDASDDAMDIDNLDEIREVEDETEDTQDVSLPAPPLRKPQSKPVNSGQTIWKRQEARLRERMGRLEAQLAETVKQRDELANQLDEYLSLSKSQMEENYESQVALYESRIEKQEEMIGELTSQLARVNTLVQEGKTSTLHFITREAADEERRAVDRQNEKLKSVIKEKDKVIQEKDKLLRDRDEDIRLLQAQLKAEIERSNMERNKVLSVRSNARDPPSASKSRRAPPAQEDYKQGMVIRLYEDTTSILVIGCKHEETDYDDNVWLFNCIYTFPGTSRSLNFTLRSFHDVQPDESSNELLEVEKMNYTPMELDKESETFINALGVLAEEFTFRRQQMDAFLEQLKEAMRSAIEEEQS